MHKVNILHFRYGSKKLHVFASPNLLLKYNVNIYFIILPNPPPSRISNGCPLSELDSTLVHSPHSFHSAEAENMT